MRANLIFWSLMLAGMLAGCGEKIEPGTTAPGKPVTVKVRTAVADPFLEPHRHEAVGTVKAKLFSTLAGKVMGTVTEVTVNEGQQVKKDQILVVMTQQQIDADYQRTLAALDEARRGQAAAESAVKMAEANADLAKATFGRYQHLISGESASPQEFDEVKAKYEAAMAAVAQAESMQAAAKKRVKGAQAAVNAAAATTRDMVVRAPYDGVITEKLVEPGDLASPGRPLVRLEGFEGYRVVFVLEEAAIQMVRVGLVLDVEIPTLPDQRIQGTVETISAVADAATRSVEVKLSIPPVPALRSGQFARVFIPGAPTEILRLPESAVVKRGQLTGVYKVDADNTLRFRLVRTGRSINGKVEILSGIKAGERYVLTPGPEAVNGRLAEEAS